MEQAYCTAVFWRGGEKIDLNGRKPDAVRCLSVTGERDELDWGYSQYFEIAADNLKPFIAMTLFTEILCKHFPDVMSAPVKRLSSKL